MDSKVIAKITDGRSYINSLRNRNLTVYPFGEKIEESVDYDMIRPSINAIAKTFDLALSNPDLASVISPFTEERVSRFLHVCTSTEELVLQNKMKRKLGQLTGTYFQRCVCVDAFNSLCYVTYEMDEVNGVGYHSRLKEVLKFMHHYNLVLGGAMTDVKGDRSLAPHKQENPDMFLHVKKRTEKGVYVSRAKAHQTGCINSHWMMVMPTMRLSEADKDYAIVGAVPVTEKGITYIYGRQSCDTRSMEAGSIDVGNAQYGSQQAIVLFDNVFIANEHIFMDGEYDLTQSVHGRGFSSSTTCSNWENDVVRI